MQKPNFDKAYDPKQWEGRVSEQWKEGNWSQPETCIKEGITKPDAKSFSIVLPPPNVTGTLHVGHASMLAIEDAVVRFKRMQGFRTLWLPGTDHAAIATQSKVEKILFETEQKTRHNLGREEFLRRVEQFARDSHDTIVGQIRRLGASVDWSREAYTLDEERNRAVRTAFQKMYDAGIIYRGHRIVNWDPVGQTTISDDEVVYKEEKAKLYYLKYGPFEIATARPETKFGDKYVVMHPDDKRYERYRDGEKITVEWINGPIEATVIKDPVIDREFGTGVMTITPAHSQVDFELAQRHRLDIEPVIDRHGKLLPIAGPFAGMLITDAREKIIEQLERKGLVVKIDTDYTHQVATAERTGAVIEPQVMHQWFVDVNKEFDRHGKKVSLKTLMRSVVAEKKIQILPERFEKIYFHWIDNLRDWCISRQIWYGHRIPVWYCLSCKREVVNAVVQSKWFFVRHGETEGNKQGVVQGDTDVPLNDTGREQAARAGERLVKEKVEVIFSSDMIRAKETADIIRAKASVSEVIIDDRLRERYMGKAEGAPIKELSKQFPGIYQYRGKPADNESYEEAEKRVWEAVSEHLSKHRHKNVVIVSHGAALRSLMRRIKNIDPEHFDSMERIPNAAPLSVDILETPCGHCGEHFFEQDPDTLDTWFSSGLWTFSTLGWPKKTTDLTTYHPTALLETGYDILFFWVARMILMSTYLLDEIPFKTVYLHGLVRDEEGRKMSKSLGNMVDPLDVIDRYGADALRLTLMVGASPGNDIKFADEKLSAMRNFVNKLWNIGRYVETAVTREKRVWGKADLEAISTADAWILFRLDQTVREVTRHLDAYNLSLAAETLRDFTWGDLADWYVEIHKIEKHDAVLVYVFDTLLRLWHPFMPFVTEALFASLFDGGGKSLMITAWPVRGDRQDIPHDARIQTFEDCKDLITRIRNVRSTYRVDPKTRLLLTLLGDHERLREILPLLKVLGRLEEVHVISDTVQPKESARVTGGTTYTGYVHLGDVIDVGQEKARLTKEIESLRRHIASLQSRLADARFTERAPATIIEKERSAMATAEERLRGLTDSLANLS